MNREQWGSMQMEQAVWIWVCGLFTHPLPLHPHAGFASEMCVMIWLSSYFKTDWEQTDVVNILETQYIIQNCNQNTVLKNRHFYICKLIIGLTDVVMSSAKKKEKKNSPFVVWMMSLFISREPTFNSSKNSSVVFLITMDRNNMWQRPHTTVRTFWT